VKGLEFRVTAHAARSTHDLGLGLGLVKVEGLGFRI